MDNCTPKFWDKMINQKGNTPEKCKKEVKKVVNAVSRKYNCPKQNVTLDWDDKKNSLKVLIKI